MKIFLILILMCCCLAEVFADVNSEVMLKAPIVDAKDADAIGIQLTKKNKNQFLMRDCPVVGNTESGIYHLPGQAHYSRMLVVNKCFKKVKCKDNRRCFDSEFEALETDYCVVKNNCRKYRKSTAKLL